MTASVAQTETRLPRAVVRQSAAIAARFAPAESATSTPAVPAAPASVPAAASATPAAPPAPAIDPRDSDPNYWKQRFNVTSGLLAKERTDRKAERDESNRQITELRTTAATSKAAVPDADIDLTQFYTPAQIETYGEEQCRVMATTAMKAAKQNAQALIDAAVQPLKEQREREVTDAKAARLAAFHDKLAELHPSYREDDVDPRWSDEHTGWLAQEDANTGVPRQRMLNIHLENLDATKVAKMFKDWKATVAPAVPTPPLAPSGSGASPTGEAVPAAASASGAPSDAEVKDYYKRSAIGKVKDDERVAFEARLKLRHSAAA